METLAGIALVVLVVTGVVAFGVSSWRRTERERRRLQARRGGDASEATVRDRGAHRSHWGGMGRPGGR